MGAIMRCLGGARTRICELGDPARIRILVVSLGSDQKDRFKSKVACVRGENLDVPSIDNAMDHGSEEAPFWWTQLPS